MSIFSVSFFGAQAGALRRLPAALVDKHLGCHALGGIVILDEIYLQLLAQELGHGVLDELVGDGFFRLVLVAGLGGKVAADQQQALLHVREGDLALALGVFVVVPEIFVQCRHKGQAGGLVGAAPVLQEAGVVIVLHQVHPVGKHHAMFSFTLYSGLSARSRPWRSASQHTGSVMGSSPASSAI